MQNGPQSRDGAPPDGLIREVGLLGLIDSNQVVAPPVLVAVRSDRLRSRVFSGSQLGPKVLFGKDIVRNCTCALLYESRPHVRQLISSKADRRTLRRQQRTVGADILRHFQAADRQPGRHQGLARRVGPLFRKVLLTERSAEVGLTLTSHISRKACVRSRRGSNEPSQCPNLQLHGELPNNPGRATCPEQGDNVQ